MRIRLAFSALLVGASLLSADLGFAEQHLATREMAQQRLAEAAAQREGDLATVQAAFSTPEAARAAATLGVDLASTRARLGTLDDAEVRELAVRAAALQSDPVAGRAFSNRQILWIALIALAVVLLVVIIA